MAQTYGICYKGSKSRLATEIVNMLPCADHFYDLFVGGGAVAHRAIFENRWNNVHINDINPLIPKLFMDCVNGKYHDEKRWVSRGEFLEQKDTDGLVAVCFSFGNNLRNYLYNEDIEPMKKAMHEAITIGAYEPMKEYGIDLTSLDKSPNLYWRRITAQNLVAEQAKDELTQRLVVCETLARYERLQQLERLKKFEHKLSATSIDYREVEIKPNSLVYCDIPYLGTDGYVTEFNHDEFYDWACSQREPVYISSYEMPEDRFECIGEFSFRSTLSRDSNSTAVVERLFIPRGQKHIKTTLF